MSQEQLNAPNGQQVSARERQYEARLQAAVESIHLRKWAVDQAKGVCRVHDGMIILSSPQELIEAARAIYEFVTEQARQP